MERKRTAGSATTRRLRRRTQRTERAGWDPSRGGIERWFTALSPFFNNRLYIFVNFLNRTNGEESPTPKEVENANNQHQSARRECE